MKKSILVLLLISSFSSRSQTSKDLLYKGKLKSDTGSVVKKTDDLSAKIDTSAKKPAEPEKLRVGTAVDSSIKGMKVRVDSPAVQPVVKTEIKASPKDNTKIWKECLAFGLTVLKMAFALGPISGGHFNPAVKLGLAAGGRFAWKDAPGYIVAQVVGAILAALVLYTIASGKAGYAGGLASNGFGEHSPGGYSMTSALWTEIVMTFGFLIVVLGATAKRASPGFAPIAIGLALTLIHLISIPVTNTSVNPARSTGPALIEGGIALQQLWFFWVYPIVLQDVSTSINNAKIGVTATIVTASNGDQRMVLTGDKSGSGNSFSLLSTAPPYGGQTSLASFDTTTTGLNRANAQNATMKIDGIEVSSSTNTFSTSVTGLTLTAVKLGTANVNVQNDSTKIVNAAQAFVDAYNAVTTLVKANSGYNSATKTGQPFTGDFVARTVLEKLGNTKNAVPPELSGAPITTLGELGITVQQSGQLTLDTTKLKNAIGTSPANGTTALNAYGKAFSFFTKGIYAEGTIFS